MAYLQGQPEFIPMLILLALAILPPVTAFTVAWPGRRARLELTIWTATLAILPLGYGLIAMMVLYPGRTLMRLGRRIVGPAISR